MGMEDLFEDDAKPQAPVEKVETPAPEKAEKEAVEKPDYRGTRQKHMEKEYEAQGRDPVTGQFIPKEDKPKEPDDGVRQKAEEKVTEAPKSEVKVEAPKPPVQEFTEKERAFLKGLEEERRKRQAMEKELADLRAKVPQAPAEAPKGFWDDPEAALKRHQQEMANLATQTRLQTAEVIARSKYADFDEKIEVFKEAVSETPGLLERMMASPDPAEFAYKTGKNFKDLREAGDIDALRQKIEKETRLRIEAELKLKAEALERERASIPPSLSDVRGATAKVNAPVWNGPPSLDEILK